MRIQAKTTARGYGHKHQQLRRKWAREVATGRVTCWRCHQPIRVWDRWDLGHDDHDRNLYRGPEHRACSRATSTHWVQHRAQDAQPPPALRFFDARTP